ncbi:MAG: TonB-dependent receptor [Sphingomonadales bacterium]|nr:TonB-dependent receptor [Sphingomonadales bacterium]
MKLQRFSITNRLLLTTAATAILSAPAPTSAQDQDAETGDDLLLEQIVVTGRAGAGIRKLDASYSISSLNSEQIDRFSPKSTADLFKSVPGVWAESSGGESGANIFFRGFPTGGDADFVTVQLNSSPIFPPSTLSFLENSTLFRIDQTVSRVEAVRGGPNPVVSNGQPGLTVNFIEKTGGPEFEGLVKITGSDFGERRADVQVSGPLDDDLFFSIGGFYRASDGIRDAEYTSERGGQISANLVKEFDRGRVMVYGRYLDDNNAWLLPIPVIQNQDGSLDDFPGFDAGTGTYHSDDIRLAVLQIAPGDGLGGPVELSRSADEGRGPKLFMIGATIDFDIGGGWEIRNRFNYLNGDANTIGGFVPNGIPLTAADFLAGQIATANDGGPIEAAAGAPATTGAFTFTSTGEALTDLSTQVMSVGWWSVEKELQSFTNDFSVSKEIAENNTVTVGFYYADYSSMDLWYLGNAQLLTAEANGRRVDLMLDNGVAVSRDGFIGAPFFDVNASYNGQNFAAYLTDEWQVTDRIRIDGGIRVENYVVDATLENVTFGVDLDGDPTTLHNNSAAILNGTFRDIDFDETEIAWTIGINFDIGDNAGVFARINDGSRFPFFDNLRDGVTNIQDILQIEAGVKANTDIVDVFATFYYNDFTGLPFQAFIDGMEVTDIGDSRTYGVEIEAVTERFNGFQLAATLTWQDAQFTQLFDSQGTDLTGNDIQRQPALQFRLTPSFETDTSFGNFDGTFIVYGTISYVGDRFSDIQNLQSLPSYTKFDAGIVLTLNERMTFQIVGDNLTDKIGLTEGNPRAIGSTAPSGVILARPILGRTFKFSFQYNFFT